PWCGLLTNPPERVKGKPGRAAKPVERGRLARIPAAKMAALQSLVRQPQSMRFTRRRSVAVDHQSLPSWSPLLGVPAAVKVVRVIDGETPRILPSPMATSKPAELKRWAALSSHAVGIGIC